MRTRPRYKIIVRTLAGKILTYSVDDFSLEDGLIVFTDIKTGKTKRFAISNCEIGEENGYKRNES